MLKETLQNIERLQGMMVACATGTKPAQHSSEYKALFIDLHIVLEKLEYDNPNKFRTLEEFWGFIKMKYSSYQERRAYVQGLYNDILIDIERKLRKEPDPKEWTNTNEVLTDELSPVRKQWLKAKNFLVGNEPDYENCIKEAINSIESALQILLKRPNETLGKAIKDAAIDDDIRRLISQAYGLASNKDFVRHGGTKDQNIAKEDALFLLNFSSISILYLKQKLSPRSA